MAIRPFLAMTATEIRNYTPLPQKIAWMACHFSPYGSGLSNLPHKLPEESLLVVDDITPIRNHDPEVITQQLLQCMDSLNISGILLDFQRPGTNETAELVSYLQNALPCPAAVTEHYAEGIDLPVFLSPVPPSVSLTEHLSPWKGREIWLDLSLWGETLTLTEDGCNSMPLPPWESGRAGFSEETLLCHYQITSKETSAQFTLWRTEEDLHALLEEAESLGIRNTVGLYQELHSIFA